MRDHGAKDGVPGRSIHNPDHVGLTTYKLLEQVSLGAEGNDGIEASRFRGGIDSEEQADADRD